MEVSQAVKIISKFENEVFEKWKEDGFDLRSQAEASTFEEIVKAQDVNDGEEIVNLLYGVIQYHGTSKLDKLIRAMATAFEFKRTLAWRVSRFGYEENEELLDAYLAIDDYLVKHDHYPEEFKKLRTVSSDAPENVIRIYEEHGDIFPEYRTIAKLY